MSEEGMTNSALLSSISSPEELSRYLPLDRTRRGDIETVSRRYPFRIPPFYANLIRESGDAGPLGRQAIPAIDEVRDDGGGPDPLDETSISVTPILLKRYPGRAVFLVSAECAMYCRFCNRKRLVGKGWDPSDYYGKSLRAIREDNGLREIILSGGDPLILPGERLEYILSELRAIERIKTVRLSTRLPVVSPLHISESHFQLLREYGPLWIVIHINHPHEITPEFSMVVRRLREEGHMLVSQTVLLRGVNNCSGILSRLFTGLVERGIKPYYLFQLDEVRGAQHFKVSVDEGVRIMNDVRMTVSGLAVPHYAMDITGGLGKIPLGASFVEKREGNRLSVRNVAGERGEYLDDGSGAECFGCGLCDG